MIVLSLTLLLQAAIRSLEGKSAAAAKAAVANAQAEKADAAKKKARLDAGFAEVSFVPCRQA